MRETTLQTPRSVKKEGEEVLQAPEQRDSPAARGEDHGEAGCPPAAHGGPRWSRYPPAACGGPHAGAGGCPKEAVTLWKAHAGAGSWQDLWTHGKRSPRWSRFAGRICWQGQPTTLLEGGKSRSSWPRHGGCSGNRNARGRFQGAVGSGLGKLATEERNQNRNSKKIEHLTPRGTDNTGHRPM